MNDIRAESINAFESYPYRWSTTNSSTGILSLCSDGYTEYAKKIRSARLRPLQNSHLRSALSMPSRLPAYGQIDQVRRDTIIPFLTTHHDYMAIENLLPAAISRQACENLLVAKTDFSASIDVGLPTGFATAGRMTGARKR